MKTSELYLEPRQAASRAPTAWEDELADVIEATFAQGMRELADLVSALNASRVRPPEGGVWTEDSFRTVVKKLGE